MVVVEQATTAQTSESPAEATYARIVDEICRILNGRELATAVGVSERTVQNWRSGATRPQGAARDALLDLYYLVGVLDDVYTPEGVEVWLTGRAKPLSGRRPLAVFAAGERESVIALAEQIRDY